MTEEASVWMEEPREPARTLRIASRFVMSTAAAILLVACAGTPRSHYADIAATVPPVSPDHARFYFYREYEPYESLARPYIYLNSQASAVSEPGGVLYRDVPQGAYLIAVDSAGLYPEQAKTIAATGGETYYIKIESLRSWASGGGENNDYERDTFVAVLVDPERARQEIPDLKFFGNL
jgi:Protein of unknown function (DUF2846)